MKRVCFSRKYKLMIKGEFLVFSRSHRMREYIWLHVALSFFYIQRVG